MSRPGKLKRRIQIQEATQVDSALGGTDTTWTTTRTTWAAVEVTTGTRALEYLQAKNERPYTVTLRQDVDINPNQNRILYGSRILIINSVEVDEDKYKYQIVNASEKIV